MIQTIIKAFGESICMLRLKLMQGVLSRERRYVGQDKSEFIVHCEYAKLGDFQFLCEMITQTERFFRKKPEWGEALVVREWGSWLRAPSRRGAVQERSKWLRDDGDDIWGEKRGEDHVQRFKIPNLAQDGMRRDKEGLNFGNQADILGVFNLNCARKINK